MTVLDKIKSFFRPSKPQAKTEAVKPVATGADGQVTAPENKIGGASEQKGGGAA